MRFLAPGVTAVFVSGLISVMCQHCLAKAGTFEGHTPDGGNNHAVHLPMEPGHHTPDMQKDPCAVYCDCEDNFISLDSSRPDAVSGNRTSSDLQFPFVHSYFEINLPRGNRLFINGKPHIPDRAGYLPLERNCVLLN